MSSINPAHPNSEEVVICPTCSGHGVVRIPESEDKRRCPTCLASGRVIVKLIPYNPIPEAI